MSNDLSDLLTADFGFDVSRGNYADCTPLNIFGFNNTLSTDFETIWNDSTAYVFPTQALEMTLVSTSGSDTMDVLISGLDAQYHMISEVVTLTGTSPVTTDKLFFRINSVVILSGSNVGNITVKNGTVTYGFIGPEIGLTQACVYTVPAGHALYIFRITANSATATGSQYVTIRNYTKSHTGRILRVASATMGHSQVDYNRQIPFKVDEKTDFQFEAKSSSSSNVVAMFIEGILQNKVPGSL